jgi:hypothetical protein
MCFNTHSDYDQFEFIVISVHLPARAFTRAGFESTTVFAPLKLLSSIIKYLRAYTAIRNGNTNQPGLLLSI